jgi:hypothetical protein
MPSAKVGKGEFDASLILCGTAYAFNKPEDVEELRALTPKRFRFADVPAVREHKERGHHIVGLKFPSLQRLFLAETGIVTLNGPYGPYKFLTDKNQIKAALGRVDKIY